MLLTLALSLAPQFSTGPQPVAPFGLPHTQPSAPISQGSGGPAIIEDFEAYSVGVGSAENIGSTFLDETTITGTGQGPGLTVAGTFYSCTGGSLQWNGDTYFGLPTKTFLANSGDSTLYVGYALPQASVGFGLHAFSGFADTATVEAYDTSGSLVDTVTVNVPGPATVSVTLTGPNIQRVIIRGTYSWSPIIDDHDFDSGSGCGLQLSATGSCPGAMTFTVNGGAPGDPCKFGYAFGTGSFVIPSGPCAGTVTGLDGTATPVPGTFVFNVAGQVNQTFFIPPGACGAVYVQAINLADCCTSNVILIS